MAAPDESTTNRGEAIRGLCPACGLCCNGVLFGSVRLQDDNELRICQDAGFACTAADETHGWQFPQPCSAFDGAFCRIYDGRPSRCRDFHCDLLQRVAAGECEVDTALSRIEKTKELALNVQTQLHELGFRHQDLPLSKQYQAYQAAKTELANNSQASIKDGRLMGAVFQMTQALETFFFPEAGF
jgi:Fe-S-cluster containining protein